MINPLLMSDFPEPDVIRVGDTYYMLCTTKHFMPGGVILKSYDLMNWEIISYLLISSRAHRSRRCRESRASMGMAWMVAASDIIMVCFMHVFVPVVWIMRTCIPLNMPKDHGMCAE